MSNHFINVFIALLLDLLALTFIYVCNHYTVPNIATIITLFITCIAGYITYSICKYWIRKWISLNKNHKDE